MLLKRYITMDYLNHPRYNLVCQIFWLISDRGFVVIRFHTGSIKNGTLGKPNKTNFDSILVRLKVSNILLKTFIFKKGLMLHNEKHYTTRDLLKSVSSVSSATIRDSDELVNSRQYLVQDLHITQLLKTERMEETEGGSHLRQPSKLSSLKLFLCNLSNSLYRRGYRTLKSDI